MVVRFCLLCLHLPREIIYLILVFSYSCLTYFSLNHCRSEKMKTVEKNKKATLPVAMTTRLLILKNESQREKIIKNSVFFQIYPFLPSLSQSLSPCERKPCSQVSNHIILECCLVEFAKSLAQWSVMDPLVPQSIHQSWPTVPASHDGRR